MKTPPDAEKNPGKKTSRKDLTFRFAYKKRELLQILPFGHTTLADMIKNGTFPDGHRTHPTAHKIWMRATVEDWMEKSCTHKTEQGTERGAGT